MKLHKRTTHIIESKKKNVWNANMQTCYIKINGKYFICNEQKLLMIMGNVRNICSGYQRKATFLKNISNLILDIKNIR